jgi:hypothetical protein
MGWKLELGGCGDQDPLALACVISGELYQGGGLSSAACDADAPVCIIDVGA